MTPRLVAVGPKGRGQRRSHHSKQILPALFSVNQDSRHCALSHYTSIFTITLTVDETGLHRWDCPEFKGTKYHANVVMSTDDTLGLFGWETLNLGHSTRFQVKSANGIRPWETSPNSHGAEPEVRKVALLGQHIALSKSIVRDFNSSVSWDMDSIIYATSTSVRKLNTPAGRWYELPVSPWTKEQILIQSRNFNGSLEDWVKRLIFRAKHGALALWSGAPDIFAFQLGKEPERIRWPMNYIPAESIRDLYNALPYRYIDMVLDDFYASREWKWSVQYPDKRGF